MSEVCESVEDIALEETAIKLIRDTLDACDNGVGLAAPQVGIQKRIFAAKIGGGISIFINPEILEASDEKGVAIEGCLSYPGIFAPVERSKKLYLRWLDESGTKQERWFMEREAICVAHESDHLNGVCLVGDLWRAQEAQRKKELEMKEAEYRLMQQEKAAKIAAL